jgi:hypothetical protein
VPEIAVPSEVAYFTVAADVAVPERLTVIVMLPAACEVEKLSAENAMTSVPTLGVALSGMVDTDVDVADPTGDPLAPPQPVSTSVHANSATQPSHRSTVTVPAFVPNILTPPQ